MIKVHYNENTGEVLGYYDTSRATYAQIPAPTIDITDEQHQNALGKTMIVENGLLQEYVEPNDLKLARAIEVKKAQLMDEYRASKLACKLYYANQEIKFLNGGVDNALSELALRIASEDLSELNNIELSQAKVLLKNAVDLRKQIRINVDTAQTEVQDLVIETTNPETEESEIDYNATIEAINNYEPSNQVVFEEELAVESLMS